MIKNAYGWLGLFLIISVAGVVALIATLLFPYRPRPGPRPIKPRFQHPILAKLGLVEIANSSEQEINYGFTPDEDSKKSEKLTKK